MGENMAGLSEPGLPRKGPVEGIGAAAGASRLGGSRDAGAHIAVYARP